MRIVNDYILQTGDKAWLDERIGESTLYERLCEVGLELHRRYARADGLLDFGEGTGVMLEIRTSGYEHVVAAANGMASDYFARLTIWAKERKDPRASEFETWATQISSAVQHQLWDSKSGWFVNLYPDGSRQLVMSYHLFDLLESPCLQLGQRQRLVEHLKSGEFTGPFGLNSIARSDRAHFDREDCDFGGGGQYVGMTLRIVESLYKLNESHAAWDLLKRSTRWTERFPYWPQTIYADELALQPHQMDWPQQLSGGAGVQTVVFGVFGLRPSADGSLWVQPSCEPDLGEASLKGYRFRNHSYDVTMSTKGFVVYRDGHEVGRGQPGQKLELNALTP